MPEISPDEIPKLLKNEPIAPLHPMTQSENIGPWDESERQKAKIENAALRDRIKK